MKTYDLTKRRPACRHRRADAIATQNRRWTPSLPGTRNHLSWKKSSPPTLATVVLAVIVCGLYPLLVWGLGQGLFHRQANGSLHRSRRRPDRAGQRTARTKLRRKTVFQPPALRGGRGRVRSDGQQRHQSRADERQAHQRPAQTRRRRQAGQRSRQLTTAVKDLVVAYRTANGLKETDPVPARRGDAFRQRPGSAHLTCQRALLQLPRVARERGKSPRQRCAGCSTGCTQGRDFGNIRRAARQRLAAEPAPRREIARRPVERTGAPPLRR